MFMLLMDIIAWIVVGLLALLFLLYIMGKIVDLFEPTTEERNATLREEKIREEKSKQPYPFSLWLAHLYIKYIKKRSVAPIEKHEEVLSKQIEVEPEIIEEVKEPQKEKIKYDAEAVKFVIQAKEMLEKYGPKLGSIPLVIDVIRKAEKIKAHAALEMAIVHLQVSLRYEGEKEREPNIRLALRSLDYVILAAKFGESDERIG